MNFVKEKRVSKVRFNLPEEKPPSAKSTSTAAKPENVNNINSSNNSNKSASCKMNSTMNNNLINNSKSKNLFCLLFGLYFVSLKY